MDLRLVGDIGNCTIYSWVPKFWYNEHLVWNFWIKLSKTNWYSKPSNPKGFQNILNSGIVAHNEIKLRGGFPIGNKLVYYIYVA